MEGMITADERRFFAIGWVAAFRHWGQRGFYPVGKLRVF